MSGEDQDFMVPGHEITGIVSGIGSKVTRYKIADRVGVGFFVDSCTVHACAMVKLHRPITID